MVALQYYLIRNKFNATETTDVFVMFSDEYENISYETSRYLSITKERKLVPVASWVDAELTFFVKD